MSRYTDLPLYKASYDLMLEVYSFVGDLGREYRYTIGERVKEEVLELFLLLYRANRNRDKFGVLEKARERIETVRLLVRLTKDLKVLGTRRFALLNERIELVSKQLLGWQKSLKK
jgi:hypothetical protein